MTAGRRAEAVTPSRRRARRRHRSRRWPRPGATAPVSRRSSWPPRPCPSPDDLDLPENVRYRLKNAVLGPPLAAERQSVERLGKPTALAVLSSDVISSSAYATEQILLQLVQVHRGGRLRAGGAGHHRRRRRAALRHRFVPRGGEGLHQGGRRLRGGARELRARAWPRSRRCRCSSTTRSRWRCRWRPGWHALTSVFPASASGGDGRDRHRLRGPHRLREPAGHPRGGPHLRRADLLLHRQHGRCSSSWARCKAVLGELHAHSLHHAGSGVGRARRVTGCSSALRCSS